jgi:hypothetical protein
MQTVTSAMFLGLAILTGPNTEETGYAQCDDNAAGPYWLDPRRNCGPTCLHFLDRYLGGTRTFAEVSAACPPGYDGTTLRQIQEAAEGMGYHTRPFRATARQLTRLDHPAIVQIRPSNELEARELAALDHFIVITGWRRADSTFRVVSPPQESASWTYREVARRFTGFGLALDRAPLPELGVLLRPARPWGLWCGLGLSAAVLASLGAFRFGRRQRPRPTGRAMAACMLLALVVASGCGAPSTDTTPKASAGTRSSTESRTVCDAGTLVQGERFSHVFRVVNPTDAPLEIERTITTCDCTTALLGDPPVIVPPGEHADVRVELDTQGLDGEVEKSVVVVTKAQQPELKAIKLTMRAHVTVLARAVPAKVHFGRVGAALKSARVAQAVIEDEALMNAITGVESATPAVQVRITERAPTVLFLELVADGRIVHGNLRSEVSVTFDHPKVKRLVIPVTAEAFGDLRSTPARLLYGSRATLVGRKRRVRIDAASQRTFKIVGVEAPAGFSVTQDQPSAEAETHWLTVTSERLAAPTGYQYVLVKTDHPEQSEFWIPISGDG